MPETAGIRLEAQDAENFTKALQDAVKALTDFVAATVRASEAVSQSAQAGQQASQAYQQTADAVSNASSKIDENNQYVQQAGDAWTSLTKQMLDSGASAQEVQDALRMLGASTSEAKLFVEQFTNASKAETEANNVAAESIKRKSEAYTSYEAVLKAIMATGQTTAQAANQIADAEAKGVSLAQQLTEAHKERDAILRQLVEGELTYAEASDLLAQNQKKEAEAAKAASQEVQSRIREEQLVSQKIRERIEAEQQAQIRQAEVFEKLREKQAEQVAQSRAASEATEELNRRIQKIIESGQAFGATGQEIKKALMDIGVSAKEADKALEGVGIRLSNTQDFERTRDRAGDVGKAFFALTLASFGLMAVTKQLKEAGQTDLVPTFEKITGVLQTVSSFGSAGAFSAGVPGAIAGGIFGFLLSAPALVDNTTEATKELIQQFDTLARKTDAADTLQRIGNVSAQTAQDLIKAAQAGGEYSQRFARDLEALARAQQAQENVIPNIPTEIGARMLFGEEGLNLAIESKKKAADADMAAAQAAIALDIEILKLTQHYADSIETLRQWTQQGDDIVSVLGEITGATKQDVDAIGEVLKVHPEWGEALLANIENIQNLNIGLKDAPQYAAEYTQELERQTEAATLNAQALAAMGAIQEENSALLQKLSQGALPDASQKLSELTGLSEETVDRFFKFADANRAVYEEASLLAEAITTDQQQLENLKVRGEGASDAADLLRDRIAAQESALRSLVSAHQDFSDVLKEVEAAQKKLAAAMQDASFRSAQLEQRTQNQFDAARQQYDNTVADAADQRNNAIFNADQNLTSRVADLWQDLQNKVIDVNQQLADRVSDINTQLANRLADIQQQLQNKIADINQDLQNKLADLAHRRQQDIQRANDDIRRAAQDLARELYEIERERIEATQALAFNTGEQLRNAQTDHDREAILRRHLFEQGQIDQEANDRRSDAQFSFAEKVAQAEKEKQLAQDNYEYEVALAKKLAAQKIAEAERAAREQSAIAQRQAAQQLATAQREHDQALAAAERRYEQEKENAVRAYNQQIEAARRAEQQKLADAQRSLEQRNDAIAKSAELERQQIQYTLQKAIEAYNLVIAKIMELQRAVAGLLSLALQLAGVPTGIANVGGAVTAGLFSDWINNMQQNIPGGQHGLDMIVPNEARFANDGFMVRASAGERVTITAPSTTTNQSRSMTNTFVINDATDPKRVAEAVRQTLETIAWN